MSASDDAAPVAVHRILDHTHRAVAATFEYPPGWRAESRVDWNFEHRALPVRLAARVSHPEGVASVDLYPIEWFCWVEPNLGFYREGQDLGDGTSLLRPMPAAEAMGRWVLPKLRGRAEGLTVLGMTPLPRLADALGSKISGGARTEGVCAKLAYRENGLDVVEELYGLRAEFEGIPTYGAAGVLVQTNWGFARLFGYRAASARADEFRDGFWNVVRTVKPEPQWEKICEQRTLELKALFEQYLRAGYQQIEAATQMSRQISAQNQQWLDQQAARREAEYQSDQRRLRDEGSRGSYSANDAFGDYLMGRETYDDPYYEYGSQHGYYDYVWTDKQGNYQYSNDANFDPNPNASSDWVLMRKKQIGD